MLQAVEAVVRGGVVVPLESIPMRENDHYLLVRLASSPEDRHAVDDVVQRREAAARWYADYLAQAGTTVANANDTLSDAEVNNIVHAAR